MAESTSTKEIIRQVKDSLGCLNGDLKSFIHTMSFVVNDKAGSFAVTITRTDPS